MSKLFISIALLVICLGVTSCIDNNSSTEDDITLLVNQTAEIDAYLTANAPAAYIVKDINGMRMVITEMGSGYPALISTGVDVDYVGKLFSNNQQFDAGSIKNTPVSTFINGWKMALTSLPAGTKATLYIPSVWGYGKSGQGSIPGDAILVFDINFKKINRTSDELNLLGKDTVAINDYLTSNSITTTRDTSGIRYAFSVNSSGLRPGLYEKVSFHITYKLLTDPSKIVGEYDLAPADNAYNRVVDQSSNGVKLMLTKMAVGAKGTFYIPSLLGYGTIGAAAGSSQIIPPNANLIVEITMKEIQDAE